MCGPGLNCVVNYGEYGINPDLEIADADYIASSTPEVYTILRASRHYSRHLPWPPYQYVPLWQTGRASGYG